jgi:exosortase A
MNARAGTVSTEKALREHRLLLFAAVTMLLIVTVYWQTFSRMVEMWMLSDYQYAWLVYPIALYVLWSKRHALASVSVQPSWFGVAATACLVFAWFLARNVGVQVVEFASASLLSLAVFWAVAGTRALKVAIFPLVLLLAAVPTGEFLVYYLQESTTAIASTLLHLAGVPAFREGLFMTLPGGSFEVAEACGGLRYLLAASMASLAYAYLTYSGMAKRVLFVAIAAVAMVVANGIRAFIVMVVASATDMQVFAGKDHVYFGMVLFAAVFAALIYVGDRYADRVPRQARPSLRDVPPASGGLLPATIAVLLFLAAGPGLLYVQAGQPLPAPVTAELPAFAECRGPLDWNRDWSPEFRGADHMQRASYACGDYPAGVYFASYASQAQGKELVSSANSIWPHEWRRYVDETAVTLDSNSKARDIRQVYLHAPDRSMLIWYWYQVGDSVLGNAFAVKLATAAYAVGLQPVEASVIVVMVDGPADADVEKLREALEAKAVALASWYRDSTEAMR